MASVERLSPQVERIVRDSLHVQKEGTTALEVPNGERRAPHRSSQIDAEYPCRSESLPPNQLGRDPAKRQTEARSVVCSPQQLRLHPALDHLGMDLVAELNEAALVTDRAANEPILITTNGVLLAGFGPWRLAIFEGKDKVDCIEYPFDSDESLQFILAHHQPRSGWNVFTRIRLALTLEPTFQQRALHNMRVGGKYKGLADLPDAQIEVRQEVARVAKVGTRNVGNVKKILQTGHPKLIDALQDGTITINRAIQWCGLRKSQQVAKLIQHIYESETNKVIRQTVGHSRDEKKSFDVMTVLSILQQQQPGSVIARLGRLRHTIILVGQDLLSGLNPQKELDLP